jgi:hypothetical protein
MTSRVSRASYAILANAKALAIGVVVAVGLVTGYEFAAAKLDELRRGPLFFPPDAVATYAAIYSAYAAVLIGLLCFPVWLLLAKYRLTGWPAAAALGFLATLAFWIGDNIDDAAGVRERIGSGLLYGLFGAIAGLSTWRARPGRSATSSSIT